MVHTAILMWKQCKSYFKYMYGYNYVHTYSYFIYFYVLYIRPVINSILGWDFDDTYNKLSTQALALSLN